MKSFSCLCRKKFPFSSLLILSLSLVFASVTAKESSINQKLKAKYLFIIVANGVRYNDAFGHLPELQIPADRAGCQHAWHLYVLRLNLEWLNISRNQFIEALKGRNIGTSVHFIPLHLHPYYRQNNGYAPDDFPVAFNEFQRVVSLPIYSKMSDEDSPGNDRRR